AQRLAVRMPDQIERRLVVEPSGLDNENVAFPTPDRVAVESRKVELLWQPPGVAVDLAMQVASLIQNDGHFGCLDDLDGLGEKTGDGETRDIRAHIRGISLGRALTKNR